MERFFYLQAKYLKDFLSFIAKNHRLFICQAKEDDYYYVQFSEGLEPVFNAYRTFEPLKSLIVPAKERIDNLNPSKEKPLAVFNPKHCDLNALAIQDFIFLGQKPKFASVEDLDVDTSYEQRRKNLLIISGDCTGYKEVCWCLGMGLKPYPESGYDINLSFIDTGYVLEFSTGKGRLALKGFERRMTKPTNEQMHKREHKRSKIIADMQNSLPELYPGPVEAMQQAVKQGFNSASWKEFMLTCVECGGCNFICDTCHCFLLSDEKRGKENARLKLWDACLYANFAKVAGGANPLDTRAKRLRNRYMKKFDFFPDNLGKYACCGCGRCIEVCPGKIDIRKILKTLHNELLVKK
jgi:ferredoxin